MADFALNLSSAWRRLAHFKGQSWLSSAAARLLPYAATALVGTALCFFLHHLANQLPYTLAKQRFAEEFTTSHPNPGYEADFNGPYEHCEVAMSLLTASGKGDGGDAFADAMLLNVFAPQTQDPCVRLKAALDGADMQEMRLKTRYWWGSRVIYGIGLRHLSVSQLRRLTEVGIYAAYAMLAAALLLLSRKALLIIAPLILLGACFSGVRHFADVVNGPGHLWALLMATPLALLLSRQPLVQRRAKGAQLCCFIAGMGSSYLWLGDGHGFLAITLIGMVVHFGRRPQPGAAAMRLAVSCIALYLAGFAACYGLGLLAKATLVNGAMENFWNQVVYRLDQSAVEASAGLLDTWKLNLALFYSLGLGRDNIREGEVLTLLSAFALLSALLHAGLRTWRAERASAAREARFGLLKDFHWIVLLLLINVAQFHIDNDLPPRIARFMFLPHALSLSCLILAIMQMNRRSLSILVDGLLVYSILLLFYLKIEEYRFLQQLENTKPIAQAEFDLHLREGKLIYSKELCDDRNLSQRYYLNIYPVDERNLSIADRRLGFERTEFHFESHYHSFKHSIRNRRCVLAVPLPDYEIAFLETGQRHWRAEHASEDQRSYRRQVIGLIEDGQPIISSVFDLYRLGNDLIYTKAPCAAADRAATFFLHIEPVRREDLPEIHRQRGWDNLDFKFHSTFTEELANGRCIATRTLPSYEMASFVTGQHLGGQKLWEESFTFGKLAFSN